MGRYAGAAFSAVNNITVWNGADLTTPRYFGFPGVTEIAHDELVVVAMRSTDESTTRDGRIVLKRSTDGGATWGTESSVVDNADDLRDPALCLTAAGTLICSLFEWQSGRGERPRITRSTDGGATWGSLIPVDTLVDSDPACSAPVVELNNGDLLLPIYGYTQSRLSRSTDGGDTWADIGVIAEGGGRVWYEPFITYDPLTGRLWCAIRSDTAPVGIYLSTSTDADPTVWSTPVRLFGGSGRPAIHLTPQRILAVDYRDTAASNRHGIRYSADFGATWTAPETTPNTSLMSYAQWCTLADGALGFAWSVATSGTTGYIAYRRLDPPALLPSPDAARVRPLTAPGAAGGGIRAGGGVGL